MRKTLMICLYLYIFVIYALPAATSGPDDLDREPLVLEVKKDGQSFLEFESYHLLTDGAVLERAAKPNQTFPFQQLVFACPLEEKDREMLTDTDPGYGNIKYCLFDKEFPAAENKRCASPLLPELNGYLGEEEEEERTPCGAKNVDSRTYIYTVAFKYCQSLSKVITPPTDERTEDISDWRFAVMATGPDIFKMYDICYNSTEKTPVWVRYTILAPTLIEDEPITNDSDISTETFNLLDAGDNYYKDMKLAFDNQNQKYQMVAQTLVPKEDLARHSWRTAALYYFSVAPLWSELKPLMDAINRTVRKLASRVKERTGKEIDIFTKAYNVLPTYEYMDNVNKRFPIPDIWVKLVRYRRTKSSNESILIYLHNTPEYPDKIPKQCDKQIPCDFGKWSATSFTNEQMKYVYCCKTPKDVLEKSFPDENIEDAGRLLSIEEWLKGFNPLAAIVFENVNLFTACQSVNEAITNEDGTTKYVPQDNEQLIYLCPAKKEIRDIFEHSSINYNTWSQCLLKKDFKLDEPQKCENPVDPVSEEIQDENGQALSCSDTPSSLYRIGYRFCGTLEHLVEELKHRDRDQNYRPKETFIESYTLCYDRDANKTISTTHSIKSSSSSYPETNYRDVNDQLNNESFRVFKMTRQIYKAQKEDDPNYMVPHAMVPREDKLSEHWWQITVHDVNTAPLRRELVPLMKVIEERIRKLANKIVPLLIYTKVFNTSNSNAEPLTIGYGTETISVPEFWSKLVMFKTESEYRGVVIYVRNTPSKVPPNPPCQTRTLCNFKRWSQQSFASLEISDDLLKYAYCCAPDDYSIKLFQINESVRKDVYLSLTLLSYNTGLK